MRSLGLPLAQSCNWGEDIGLLTWSGVQGSQVTVCEEADIHVGPLNINPGKATHDLSRVS